MRKGISGGEIERPRAVSAPERGRRGGIGIGENIDKYMKRFMTRTTLVIYLNSYIYRELSK